MAGNVSKIDGLTAKQQAFVERYAGNAEEAARAAGYSDSFSRVRAHELLRRPEIIAAIKARKPTPAARKRIADREERQRFWTRVLRGQVGEPLTDKNGQPVVDDNGQPVLSPAPLKERLKASELLGKSEGDFLDRVEVSADSSFADMLKAARERSARR